MSITFQDRVSAQPNRYKVIKADGTTEYVVLERADEPTTLGTPLNAETLNAAFADKAPNGFGLGLTTPTAITTTEDLDATKKCGFYRYAISNSVICGISFSSASMIVYSNTSNSCVQELRPHKMNYCLRRNYVGGSTNKWSDWEEVGLVFKQVWRNASPTSDFSAQTIALDLSGYDAVYVEAVRSTNSNVISGRTMVSVGGLSGFLMGTTDQLTMIRREVKATTTGVVVSAYQSANNSNGTSNEIPYRIYGIKNPHELTQSTSG